MTLNRADYCLKEIISNDMIYSPVVKYDEKIVLHIVHLKHSSLQIKTPHPTSVYVREQKELNLVWP